MLRGKKGRDEGMDDREEKWVRKKKKILTVKGEMLFTTTVICHLQLTTTVPPAKYQSKRKSMQCLKRFNNQIRDFS